MRFLLLFADTKIHSQVVQHQTNNKSPLRPVKVIARHLCVLAIPYVAH